MSDPTRQTGYDASLFRDAYLKGTADFKTDIAAFEDELTGQLQRTMIFTLWSRAPESVRQAVKQANPEAYEWMTGIYEEMKEEANG